MANGFGLTESDPTSFGFTDPGALTGGSVAVPTAAPAAAASAARRSSANPLSVIGFALSSVAAGLQGKPLPKDPTTGGEDLDIKRLNTGLAYASKFAEIADSTPPDQVPALVKKFVATSGGAFGAEFEGFLSEIGKSKDKRQLLRALPPEVAKPFIEMAGGTTEALKLASDPNVSKMLLERAHAMNAADIQTTYTEVAKKLDALPPEAQAKLPRDAKGKLALTTSEFAALGKQYGFLSDSQVYTLNSNPDAFAGFLTPPSVSKALTEKRGATALEGDKEIRVATAKAGIENAQPSDLKKKLTEAGLKPATPEFNKAMLAALLKPQTQINMGQETAFNKEYGGKLGEQAAELHPAAEKSRKQIARIDQLQGLLQNLETGKLTPTKSTIGAWADALSIGEKTLSDLGLKKADAVNAQAVTAITNALMVEQLGPGGFPSQNFSDKDREFMEATLPQVANTPGGNRIIAQALKSMASRNIEKESMWIAAQKGKTGGDMATTYRDFLTDWNEHVKNTPLFPNVKSAGELASLKSGTVFTAPDGSVRVKP